VEQEGDMHLVSLEVQGLKSLRDTKIEGLRHYNVFIGKNDSGKSTILQAMRIMKKGNNEVQSLGARELMTDKPDHGRLVISMTFQLSDPELSGFPGIEQWSGRPEKERVRCWRYDVEHRLGNPKWPEANLCVVRAGPVYQGDFGAVFQVRDLESFAGYRVLQTRRMEILLRTQGQKMSELLESLPVNHWSVAAGRWVDIQKPMGSGDFYWELLRHFVQEIHVVPPNRQVVDELGIATQAELDPSGANLTQVLEILERNDRPRYRAVLGLARRLFPHLSDLHFTREGHGVRFRVAERQDQEPLDAFRLSQVGTGIDQAILLGTRVALSNRGAVILMEEPENNLHPGAQRDLARWLREQAIEGDKQILVTTHSTIFASSEECCSTYLVRLDEKDGTRVSKLEAGNEGAVKEELGLRNVDLYGCNMVVLCEGDSEMVAMPVILDALVRKLGTTLPALGVAWRNLGGAGNSKVRWVEGFLRLLKDIDVRPYILADDDPDVRDGLERLVRADVLGQDEYHIWDLDKTSLQRNAGVSSEFEDNWTNQQLVDIASEMAREEGISLDLTAARFAELCRESDKRSSKVLDEYCWSEGRYDLDKRELNRRLALLVGEEIASDARRAAAQYQVVEVTQHILVALGVLAEQDAPESEAASGQ
jgi:ABC-type cobalamin/Fe3+-siderophores transport system ATPase subunit